MTPRTGGQDGQHDRPAEGSLMEGGKETRREGRDGNEAERCKEAISLRLRKGHFSVRIRQVHSIFAREGLCNVSATSSLTSAQATYRMQACSGCLRPPRTGESFSTKFLPGSSRGPAGEPRHGLVPLQPAIVSNSSQNRRVRTARSLRAVISSGLCCIDV